MKNIDRPHSKQLVCRTYIKQIAFVVRPTFPQTTEHLKLFITKVRALRTVSRSTLYLAKLGIYIGDFVIMLKRLLWLLWEDVC